jgi:hypothetical protein
MMGFVMVLGRVFPRRLIATPDVSTRGAQAQMNPSAAGGQALGATVRRSGANVVHF